MPLGIGGGGFISGGNGISQQESPPDMRGRLLALTAVAFLGSTPIGGPITGVVGDAIGAEWALAYGSVIALATAAVAVVVRSPPRRCDADGAEPCGRLALGRVECQMLDDRKTAILSAVVQEYIATALPVGSTHIADAPGVRVSSATVRNEMAVLEQEGYLVQPHTSAGRIPTDKGYRFFVDHLGTPGLVDSPTQAQVGDFFRTAHGRLEEMLHRTSDLLATSRTTPPSSSGRRPGPSRCAACSSCALSSTLATVVVVLGNGGVESEQIELDDDVSDARWPRPRPTSPAS